MLSILCPHLVSGISNILCRIEQWKNSMKNSSIMMYDADFSKQQPLHPGLDSLKAIPSNHYNMGFLWVSLIDKVKQSPENFWFLVSAGQLSLRWVIFRRIWSSGMLTIHPTVLDLKQLYLEDECTEICVVGAKWLFCCLESGPLCPQWPFYSC